MLFSVVVVVGCCFDEELSKRDLSLSVFVVFVALVKQLSKENRWLSSWPVVVVVVLVKKLSNKFIVSLGIVVLAVSSPVSSRRDRYATRFRRHRQYFFTSFCMF